MVEHVGQKNISSKLTTLTRGVGKKSSNSSQALRSKSIFDRNGYKTYKYSNIRNTYNSSRSFGSATNYSNYSYGYYGNSGNSGNFLTMLFTTGLSLVKQLFGLGSQAGTSLSNISGRKDGNIPADLKSSTVNSTYSRELSSANSFSKISSLEQKAETQKASLNSDYKELDISESLKGTLTTEDVKSGLGLVGVSLDTDSIKLSDLNSDDLEASMETIDNDINKVTNFQTSDVPQAEAKVTQKSGEVTQQITSVTSQITKLEAQKAAAANNNEDTTSIESQIEELKTQKKELEKQKSQLDAAKTALDDVKNQCASTIESLQAKKSEVSELKKFEDEVKDKKYDLAKEQDENLKKTMEKIDKLTKEIDSLQDKNTDKADKSDQKRLQKYNSLISERSGLYTTLSTLTASLASAGATEFENSKGNTYTLQNLDKALSYGKEIDDE